MRIRTMQVNDLLDVRVLCEELGYPLTNEELAVRYENVIRQPNHELLVAENFDGKVMGWVHVYERPPHLCSGPRSELGGLVVSEKSRGKGVGKLLLREAESWSMKNGLGELVFTSNAKRELAHKFYLNLGYEIRKTSYWIGKELSP